jgi:hypothetical protein
MDAAKWKEGDILVCRKCKQEIKVTKAAEKGEGAVACCGTKMRKGGQ